MQHTFAYETWEGYTEAWKYLVTIQVPFSYIRNEKTIILDSEQVPYWDDEIADVLSEIFYKEPLDTV